MGNIPLLKSSASSHPPGISDSNWSSGDSDPTAICLRSKDIMPAEGAFFAVKAACGTSSDLNKWINLVGLSGGSRTWGSIPDNYNLWQTMEDHVTDSRYQFVNFETKKVVCLGAHSNVVKHAKIATIDLNNDNIAYRLGKTGIKPYMATPAQLGVDADAQGRDILLYYDMQELIEDCSAARAFTEMKRDELADEYNMINGKPKELWFNADLMHALCNKRGDPSACPWTSKKFVDSEGKVKCSNMLACDLCKEWALNTDGGSAAAETLIADWCDPSAGNYDPSDPDNAAKSDPACKCARIWDRAGTSQHGASASCWYGPCQDRGFNNYLVPKEFRDLNTKTQCPGTLCEVVWNLEDAQDIDLRDINTVMDCGGGSKPWYKTESGLILIGGTIGILGLTLIILNSSYKNKK